MNEISISHLKQRLLFGSCAITSLVLIFVFSQHPIGKIAFTGMVSLVSALSVWEFFQISKAKNFQPLENLGAVAAAIIVISGYFINHGSNNDYLITIVLLATALLVFLSFFYQGTNPLSNIAITLFAQVYIAIPLAYAILISNFFPEGGVNDSRWWLCYLLAVTKMTDIAAYFAGKSIGKNKITPSISPNKTWEGAFFGFLFSILTSVAFYFASKSFSPSMQLSLFQSIWLGALLSILALIGDLAESLLKRDMDVKDSNGIPGIGGMLDAVDSLIFTIPALYLFLKITHP